ncbi:T9SS type A sorting domain-containing protein [Fulvivirga sp. M361]|uniref:T9SS type A sorting domain-containing protein n=1 Tax=Fulvivirga sp. M361 TaxID=2594266 RepID=UPI0016292A3D|nr:T9SS type A sorting domain-containing protein [Fulvivirga sp. M361]
MKQNYRLKWMIVALGAVLLWSAASGQSNMVFSGGALYHDIDENSDIIRSSGFNTVVLWSVHIGPTGDLILNDGLIAEDGEYAGRADWPASVHKLLEAPTSVERIELSVGSAQVPDWENIEALVNAEGTGPTSTLYKNFAKLKEILPITAINNDDESNYDVPTTVAFSKMLIDLGYKITFAPYTRGTLYWQPVYDELEAYQAGSVDKVYLQAYAGGSGNNPADWNNLFGIEVTPGLWSYNASCASGDSPQSMETRMKDWDAAAGIDGGFIWLFEDILRCSEMATARDYANAINRAFNIPAPALSKASDPTPVHQATEISVDGDLSWTAGTYDATHVLYFGTDPSLTDSDLKGELTASFYDPGTLVNNTVYYWRVDEKNSTGELEGDTWSFTTEVTTPLPGASTSPVPANMATGIRATTPLSWEAGANAVSYDVYFGTENPPPFIGNQSATSYAPADLQPLTTYYWQVNSVNSTGTTTGEIWSYTVQEPNIAPIATVTVSSEFNSNFSGSKLVDGISGVAANGIGEWASSGEQTPTAKLTWDNEVSIKKVVLYDRPSGAERIDAGILEFGDGSTVMVGALPNNGSALEVNFPEKNTTSVEFRVTAGEGPNVGMSEFEVFGLDLIGGSPSKPRLTRPRNESVDIDKDITLDWGFTKNATTFKVYLSESSTITENDLLEEVTATELDVTGLKANTTYHWRVDAMNFLATIESDVFSFTTIEENTVTSIDAEDLTDAIQIYPNPTTGVLAIEFQNNNAPISLLVYAPLGNKILEQNRTIVDHKITLDLSRIASEYKGIYFLRFTQSGKQINRKIMLE